MKKAVIIGARADGHAKVVLEVLLAQGGIEVLGFIDDDASKKGQLIRNFPVLGILDELPQLIRSKNISCAIVAIGHNSMRRALAIKVQEMGLELINAIHPTVHLDSDVQLGKGNYLGQGVIIVTGARIGNCVNIHTGTTIDHDNIIEDGANLGPGVHTAGRVKIGKDAFLGTGTLLIPDVSVGEGVIAGAGTVIIKSLPPFIKVVGNPARQIAVLKA
jgi:sugar O-acyltransferase (sialic acid O-acetyltransferase NeuD family)